MPIFTDGRTGDHIWVNAHHVITAEPDTNTGDATLLTFVGGTAAVYGAKRVVSDHPWNVYAALSEEIALRAVHERSE